MSVVVLIAVQEAVVMVKTPPGRPELLVAGAQMPLANNVGRVVSSLEFICQSGEAGVQPVENVWIKSSVVETGVYWVPKNTLLPHILWEPDHGDPHRGGST